MAASQNRTVYLNRNILNTLFRPYSPQRPGEEKAGRSGINQLCIRLLIPLWLKGSNISSYRNLDILYISPIHLICKPGRIGFCVLVSAILCPISSRHRQNVALHYNHDVLYFIIGLIWFALQNFVCKASSVYISFIDEGQVTDSAHKGVLWNRDSSKQRIYFSLSLCDGDGMSISIKAAVLQPKRVFILCVFGILDKLLVDIIWGNCKACIQINICIPDAVPLPIPHNPRVHLKFTIQ